MDKETLFTKFSFEAKSKRDVYIRDHPEILDVSVIDWAIQTALSQDAKNKKRIAEAGLYLATKMNDSKRQGVLRQMLL